MTDNNETIIPTDVPLTRKANAGDSENAQGERLAASPERQAVWYQSPRTVFFLVGLILLALAVIFTLPQLVAPVSKEPVAVTVVDSAPVPGQAESPWHEAQLAKVRRQAQDILDRVLEKQSYLEKKGVEFWALEDYTEAVTSAAHGDNAYRSRRFDEALERYQQAEQQLSALEQQIPSLLAASLADGERALDEGDQQVAITMFERALQLEPGHEQAIEGLQRSATLLEVTALLQQADQAVHEGDNEQAIELLNQALAIDPAHLFVKEQLQLVEQTQGQLQFLAVMSDGYEALETGRYAKAVAAFQRALAINPNDEAANNGLQQARTRQTSVYIETSLAKANALEQAEDWQQAVAQYQQVLDRDASIIDARIGQIRSQARADLDSSIEKLLADPARLATAGVRDQGGRLLADARGINSPGVKLQSRITSLGELLTSYATPISIDIRSDNKTRVTVFKYAELGRFSQKNISLKPGHYVAVGSRKGYRDVRVEFDVASGSRPAVEVICREPV